MEPEKVLPTGGASGLCMLAFSTGMEIKLDVTNPVMIQRAREQLEEAEKRAELIKPLGMEDIQRCHET